MEEGEGRRGRKRLRGGWRKEKEGKEGGGKEGKGGEGGEGGGRRRRVKKGEGGEERRGRGTAWNYTVQCLLLCRGGICIW